MQRFRIVDARMGRGKTSAAVRYMLEHNDRRFLYVTPYRSETSRVCVACGYAEPDSKSYSQQEELRKLIAEDKSVCITQSLFRRLNQGTLSELRKGGYSLIVDETIDAIETIPAKKNDIALLTRYVMTADKDGLLSWDNGFNEYQGRFEGYKNYCDMRELYLFDGLLYRVLNPAIFERFYEVFIMTYEFMGSLLEHVLKMRGYGERYKIVGIEHDEDGPYFSDEPDNPEPIDYRELIHVIGDGWKDELYSSWNFPGSGEAAFSVTWYSRQHGNAERPGLLKMRLGQVMRLFDDARAKDRLWTTYKKYLRKFMDKNNRYLSSFAPINSRATNEFREAYIVAYFANRYVQPSIVKFFKAHGIDAESDQYALSEMLQFIWRSRIRDGKEIYLYLPSKRMRRLFKRWMERLSNGSAL